jgi:hypothetical protein
LQKSVLLLLPPIRVPNTNLKRKNTIKTARTEYNLLAK